MPEKTYQPKEGVKISSLSFATRSGYVRLSAEDFPYTTANTEEQQRLERMDGIDEYSGQPASQPAPGAQASEPDDNEEVESE